MYKKIEEAALNAWPALQTVLRDGWLLRVSNGYTKRSNSVSPLYSDCSITDVKEQIQNVERFYAGVGLDAVFKITPFIQPAALDEMLSQSGYKLADPSCVKLRELPGRLPPSRGDVRFEESLSEGWLEMAASLHQLTASQLSTTRKLLERSPLKQGFATVYKDGVPVSCGFGVVDDHYLGLFDIMTAPGHRQHGHGEQLIRHLLEWGEARGAEACYLLVAESNKPAVRLYDKLGFETIYKYWYRVKPFAQN
ncbi:GNAT family N-acetyltransferase [Paenibacillus mendelii]|uniref:GNAT family N-acetyltransferase n=1 Tax=Paenibacillus mendelii TaxID=206163 RepID=A0ABV6JAW8_9BACL|nr:GNAT family N-acetyltransferase [Paenibacillus mendelii]MCQ6562923.1 GNAT family N-acetyltransferase [Paenibacillus mendelii]